MLWGVFSASANRWATVLAILAIVATVLAPALHDHDHHSGHAHAWTVVEVGEAVSHDCDGHGHAHVEDGVSQPAEDDDPDGDLGHDDSHCQLCFVLSAGTFRIVERIALASPVRSSVADSKPVAVVRSREPEAVSRPRAPPATS